jgi:hypothetical protein
MLLLPGPLFRPNCGDMRERSRNQWNQKEQQRLWCFGRFGNFYDLLKNLLIFKNFPSVSLSVFSMKLAWIWTENWTRLGFQNISLIKQKVKWFGSPCSIRPLNTASNRVRF